MVRKITLTTEYEIDFDDEGSLEYLFNAIIGEGNTRLKKRDESSEGGLSAVYHNCLCELHYVAGQLHHMGSELDLGKLVNEFGFHWDKIAEKLDTDLAKVTEELGTDMTKVTENLETNTTEEDNNPTVHNDECVESKNGIKQILCDKRLQRGADCERWILDGKKESGELINDIGSLIILYDVNGRFAAQGMISNEYSLSYTKESLRQFLEQTLGRFGIDLGSGGTLQFMCSDYYIDIGF